MNQSEYLKELELCLSQLDRTEIDMVIEYYAELINDKIEFGMSEQEILTQFGTPQELADKILADSQEYENKSHHTKLEKSYVKKTYTINDNEISSIKVYTDMMKVKVCYREDNSNQIRITYFENNKHNPTITNENGTITLNDKMEFSASNIFSILIGFNGIKRSRLETVIEIPRNNKKLKIHIETNNAKITATALTINNLYLKTSNANIYVSGDFTNDLYCKTSNAKIVSENITACNITFDTNNGSCSAETIISKSLSINTSNASINVTNINSDFVNLKTSNSSINLGNIIAKNSFYAKTSNGRIHTKGITSNKIEFYSSNGSISSIIAGKDNEFTIQSKTSNGNNNLLGYGNSAANKSISAYTSNGKISINFNDGYNFPDILQHM